MNSFSQTCVFLLSGVEVTCTGSITASLSLQHDVVVSSVFISLERYASKRSPLLLNIRREGVAL